MTDERRPYHAYLLRLWQVNTATGPAWHASLEDAHTGERKGFADLRGLVKFLEEQTNGADQRSAEEKGDHNESR